MLVSFGAGATLAALRPDVLQAVPQDAALLLGLALGLAAVSELGGM